VITIQVYAVKDNGGRGYALTTLRAAVVPAIGEVLRVPEQAITYWIVQQLVWERLTANPEVELWCAPY
jgi:hypothetical protein